MRIINFFLIQILLFAAGAAWASASTSEEEIILTNPFTEEQRLKGFYLHRKYGEDFERDRLSGVGEVKKNKSAWTARMLATLPEYKDAKAKEAAPLDEASPDYRQDQKNKDQFDRDLEQQRKKYIAARDLAREKKKKAIKLSEEEEYGLNLQLERVDFAKRELYTGRSKKMASAGSSGSAGSGSGGGGSGFETTPPAPPPMPPPSEFYEPDIPVPPPPPMMDGFDDNIPPPIFDEPEY